MNKQKLPNKGLEFDTNQIQKDMTSPLLPIIAKRT